jgi:Flp pilus assembly protein TadD/predicted Zn-dependent protease with MMP-like domain
MTRLLSQLPPLRAASFPAAALCVCSLAVLSCNRTGDRPLAPPQKSASVVVPPSAVTSPSAATAKPIDAADGLRGESRRPRLPPAAPCLPPAQQGQEAGLPELLEQASRDFEQGRYEQALTCAREASRLDEGSVAAHHFRGAALAELSQLEEARTAFARALALDPDDAEVLRSAADLYVRRLGGRDDLELALQYVRRAMPRAVKNRDRLLQKELFLLQSMALDDLGRSSEALAAVSRAVELDPKDREARREKGVALFELCRFDQAKIELTRLAAEEPDAWAEHYLGLIAEREQDDVAALSHFARAQKLDPDAFKPTEQTTPSTFAGVVRDEVAHLPSEIRQGLARSQFAVEELPEVTDLVATDPPLSPGILGLFRPPPDGAPVDSKPYIILYRRNLSRAAHSGEELHREVRDTLMHEVGHLNGEDDEQLRDRGL